jgi:hypothetical protein
MDAYQITCINRPNRTSPHEHITHVGNLAGKWRMTRERAITEIDAKRMAFYTVDRTTGKKMDVEVIRETGKVPYLRTRADGKLNDNLLQQDDCDGTCKLV